MMKTRHVVKLSIVARTKHIFQAQFSSFTTQHYVATSQFMTLLNGEDASIRDFVRTVCLLAKFNHTPYLIHRIHKVACQSGFKSAPTKRRGGIYYKYDAIK